MIDFNYRTDVGKRLKSDKNMIMHIGFPESEEKTTIPPGRPSNKITGYNPKGFYSVSRTGGYDGYIKNDPSVKLVSKDAKDNSSLLDSAVNFYKDQFNGLKKTVSDNAGYLSKGFDSATNDLTNVSTSIFGSLGNIALGVGGIVIAVLILILSVKLAE